jgi:hypothetical protein
MRSGTEAATDPLEAFTEWVGGEVHRRAFADLSEGRGGRWMPARSPPLAEEIP